MIRADRIAEQCRPPATQVAIEVVAETGSTNSDLLQRVGSLTTPVLRVAESQTQGRGRAGRVWHAEPGASLTFSLAWKFDGPTYRLSGLSLAVGVAVADALEDFGVRTALKWPNDIISNGSKLGGILIETETAGDAVWAVIGIGLNLMLPDTLETRIGQPAAESRWLAQMNRDTLMAGLLNHLALAMERFESEGFLAFAPRWNALHAHPGKAIALVDGEHVLAEGVAVGVDEYGRLLLDTAAGRMAVAAGDVSLRTKE